MVEVTRIGSKDIIVFLLSDRNLSFQFIIGEIIQSIIDIIIVVVMIIVIVILIEVINIVILLVVPRDCSLIHH